MTEMNVKQPPRDNSEIAFGVVVLAAFVVLFTTGDFKPLAPLSLLVIALGLIYLAVGIFGSRLIKRDRRWEYIVAYFLVEIPLGAGITYLGKANTWLVLLPLVGSAVEYLSSQWRYVVIALIWGAMMLPFYVLAGWEALLSWGMAMLAAVVFVAIFVQATVSEQHAREELAEAHRKLQAHAAQAEELAVAQERNRLAREIHDGLGHYLTAINIQIKAAQAMNGQDSALTTAALDKARTLTEEALADVRRSISSLRADPTTSRPLPEILSRLLAETQATGVQTQLSISGTPRPLSPQVEFAFYRAAQEALTNVRKHAQATHVDLCLEYLERSVRLYVQDDGVGAEQPGGGFGLVGLKERGEMLGGNFSIDTAPGRGFKVTVEIPTE